MANEVVNMEEELPVDKKAEKKRLKEERNKIKSDRKAQKKEAKQRAKEISEQEAKLSEDEEAGGVSVFLVTVVIVIIWIAILCLLIKLDVGGFRLDTAKRSGLMAAPSEFQRMKPHQNPTHPEPDDMGRWFLRWHKTFPWA